MFIISSFWAFLITFPLAAFVLSYIGLYFWKKDKKLALRWSINITNIFLIYAVSVIYSVNWPQAVSVWLWIIFIFLGIGAAIGWLQWKTHGKISLVKICFSMWRLSFLLFGITYVFLFGIGILIKMQSV